jgi:membrane protease YdiL (CAAX protease family)
MEPFAWGALAAVISFNQSAILVFALKAVYGDPATAPAALLQNLSYVSPAFPLLLGLLALARLKAGRHSLRALFGFSADALARDLLVGVGAAALSIAVTVASLRVMAGYFPSPSYGALPTAFHLYFATIGAVVPGVCEELYFRGLMFRVRSGWPRLWLLALSAAAFSLWHVGAPIYLLHTFVLGLLWGAMFMMFGRLAPGVIAHVMANAGFGLLLLGGFEVFPA